MAQLIWKLVMSSEQRVKESEKDNKFTQTRLQISGKHIKVPGEAMQSDLIPELHPAGGYENIVTALDVSSRYLFAYNTTN